MDKANKNYRQEKITGGKQKVILNEAQTAETDELDPKFKKEMKIVKEEETVSRNNTK